MTAGTRHQNSMCEHLGYSHFWSGLSVNQEKHADIWTDVHVHRTWKADQREDVCVCCWGLCEPIAQLVRPYAPGCLPITRTGPDREVLLSNCSWFQFGELAGLMSVWGRQAPLPVVGFKQVYQAKCNRRNAQAVFLGMLPWPGWQER